MEATGIAFQGTRLEMISRMGFISSGFSFLSHPLTPSLPSPPLPLSRSGLSWYREPIDEEQKGISRVLPPVEKPHSFKLRERAR